MSDSFSCMLKRSLRSHLGHILLVISWCFILFVFARPSAQGPQFVDCVRSNEEGYTMTEVNKSYPIWTQAVAVTHIPSIFVTRLVTKLVQRIFLLSCVPTAQLELSLFLLFSSIQWLLVASVIDSGIQWWRSSRNQHRIQHALGADSP
jgi:hypothetical protein